MKVNNKWCNINDFEYDKKTRVLKVKYKVVGIKVYNDFTEKDFNLLCKKNDLNKTLGTTLKKVLKK